MTYSHRNGERTPPTQDGYFWTDGDLDLIQVLHGFVYVCGGDESVSFDSRYLDGVRYWGPLVHPMEE